MIISVVSGGFDPIHTGHLSYIKSAKAIGDKLIVCLNSDDWLKTKKGAPFMSFNERYEILQSLKFVDDVINFDDSDGSCIEGLKKIQSIYPNDQITFCNGGDRTSNNIPEMSLTGIEFKFGIGGDDKKNSSSKILKNWSKPLVKRKWGYYRVLESQNSIQVKELIFEKNTCLSNQRHFNRAEHWYLTEGDLEIRTEDINGLKNTRHLKKGDHIDIPPKTWHQAINKSNSLARVIEIWSGDSLSENDIQRRDELLK